MLFDFFNLNFNEFCALFVMGLNLFVLVVLVSSFVFIRRSKKKWNKLNNYLDEVTKTVNSIRYGNLSKKINKMDLPDINNLASSLNRMIESLHDRESMIVEYQHDLTRQNKFLEAAINSLSDGLIVTDSDGTILRATLKFAEWVNIEGNKLIGKSIYDLMKIPFAKPLQALKDDEISIVGNKVSNFTASSVELKLDDKEQRYVVIIKDVTNQIELETVKEDFVATLTHDLKVPIIAETNMIELFLNENFGKISDKQRLALKNMQASNKELLDLVQVVLETYKIKGGKITLFKENIMLKSFINDIIEEMVPIAVKTGNRIEFSLERDIRVFADRFQLKRVLKNLIQNAISYGEPKSPIIISIGEIPGFVTIKVKDHGAGISQEDISKIFNKYYSAAKKFRKIGTGLGLYLALQILKAHNGDLNVESKEGEYTEFCIKIPV